MKLATIIITLLLIGGFVTGMSTFYGALSTSYGMNSTNFSTMVRSEEISTNIETQMQTMKAAEQNQTIVTQVLTALSAPLNLAYGAFNAGMIVLQAPIYFDTMITDLMIATGAPIWVKTMAYGIISVIVLFAIIGFLTGRDVS